MRKQQVLLGIYVNHGQSGCSSRQLDRAEDGLCLVHGLAVLEVGLGVRHGPAASLHVDDAILPQDDGPDVEWDLVEVAVEAGG